MGTISWKWRIYKREWNCSTQCLCFPSDQQPNGRRLEIDHVLLDVECSRVGFFFWLKFCVDIHFWGKKRNIFLGENILSGSLMRGITFKSPHKLSPSPEQFGLSKWQPGKLEKIQTLWEKCKTEKILHDLCEPQMTCWFANAVKMEKYRQLKSILIWTKGHWRPEIHVKYYDTRCCTVAAALGSYNKER